MGYCAAPTVMTKPSGVETHLPPSMIWLTPPTTTAAVACPPKAGSPVGWLVTDATGWPVGRPSEAAGESVGEANVVPPHATQTRKAAAATVMARTDCNLICQAPCVGRAPLRGTSP